MLHGAAVVSSSGAEVAAEVALHFTALACRSHSSYFRLDVVLIVRRQVEIIEHADWNKYV